ncbi:unnamed protein product [Colias eurytheme]|nr:unnamed protein product [Colias eurytheme]
MRLAMKESMDGRFLHLEEDKYYSLATLLDPRYKMNFFAPSNVQMIRRMILTEAVRRCYEELASVKQPVIDSLKSPIAGELDRYLSESLLPIEQCPYGWWCKNKEKYPCLGILARIFLSSPGSSVYSERLFSEAGNLYEKKRNRLLPEKAEALVFMHHNLPKVNFQY